MTKEELATIQERIDYHFQNEDLLLQAFTRKSYAMENGGCDNEILEFIGDKVLDLIVVKYLSDSYGSYAHDDEEYDSNEDFDDFLCEYDEGELTDFKAIGIRLTENGAMLPHGSVSGLMLAHPKATYFAVGKIGKDQFQDYVSRRGLDEARMRQFLRANL